MSCLYVYALLEGPALTDVLPLPVVLFSVAGAWAAVQRIDGPPSLSEAAMRRHDYVVRQLAARFDAVLPARFGQMVANMDDLRDLLEPRAPAVGAALARVRGCVQMTVRIFPNETAIDRDSAWERAGFSSRSSLPPEPPERVPQDRDGGVSGLQPCDGPGRRYLEARWRSRGRTVAASMAAVRRRCAGIPRCERVTRDSAKTGITTLYHLVPANTVERYLCAMDPDRSESGQHFALSGPWPPYAFATIEA